MVEEDIKQEVPDVEEDEEVYFYWSIEEGCFGVDLPSGPAVWIQPVNPRALSRLSLHYRSIQPEVPVELIPTGSPKIMQKFSGEDGPEYKEELQAWSEQYMSALLMRCIWDGLIVPEDDDWAWKHTESGLAMPENPAERSALYAEEVYPSLLGRGKVRDQDRFIEAVRQLSLPTEAVIEAMRRKFRITLAGNAAMAAHLSEGGVHVESGDRGAEGAGEVPDVGEPTMGDDAV